MKKRGRSFGWCLYMILLLAFSGCATMGSEEKIKEAEAHYQLGVSYLNSNDIQPAFVEFQKALELNPNNKETHKAIGLIYLQRFEDYPKAIEHFQWALKIDKNFSEASNNLGVAYEKTGRYSDAIESYKRALSNPLYRNAERAFNNLGRAYYRVKRYNEALDAYKDAIKRFPDFHFPYYGIALCYNALGRYSEAAVALRKAFELDPAYKGDREKAFKEMKERKLMVKGEEEKDIEDLIEIMNY